MENELREAIVAIWRLNLSGANVGTEAGEWFTLRVRADADGEWQKVVGTRTIGELFDLMNLLASWLPKGVEVQAARCWDYNKELRKFYHQPFLLTQTGVEKRHLKAELVKM